MRTFIAIELDERFVDETSRLARLLARSIEGRFMDRATYHLTLAFLGDVDEGTVASAMGAVDSAVRRLKERAGAEGHGGGVPIAVTGLGTFGRPRDATLWLGVARSAQLDALAEDVRDGLAARGVAFDGKPFKPHVTLARRARIPAGILPDLPFPNDGRAEFATVFKSRLSSEGATYEALYRAALG